MTDARDEAGYEDLVKKLKTKPFDPEAPFIPPPTSYEALVGIGDDLNAEREIETPLRNAQAERIWEGT